MTRVVYRCLQCPKTYDKKELLKRHANSHLSIRPHQCDSCESAFARSDALLRHKRLVHDGRRAVKKAITKKKGVPRTVAHSLLPSSLERARAVRSRYSTSPLRSPEPPGKPPVFSRRQHPALSSYPALETSGAISPPSVVTSVISTSLSQSLPQVVYGQSSTSPSSSFAPLECISLSPGTSDSRSGTSSPREFVFRPVCTPRTVDSSNDGRYLVPVPLIPSIASIESFQEQPAVDHRMDPSFVNTSPSDWPATCTQTPQADSAWTLHDMATSQLRRISGTSPFDLCPNGLYTTDVYEDHSYLNARFFG